LAVYDRREAWLPQESPFQAIAQPVISRPPNVIIILADDLGSADLACYGSLHNKTPRLDQLAAQGVRFTDGYATAPTCSPTRIALYTGRYPQRLTVGMEEPLVTRDADHGIPEDHPTLPSLLRDHGYRTAMYGKWHCGWLPWFSPLRIGFDTFFGNYGGALDYFSHLVSSGAHDLYEGEVEVDQIGYYTELISNRAVEFIEEAADGQPFYLQVNYTAPHWPWEGPNDQEWSQHVSEALTQPGQGALFDWEGGSLEKYAEMVEALDSGVGSILDALDEQGLADNTIVVFMSDNGGERFSFMWPFVGEKGDLEEGGIRIPFIIRWPAHIAPGQVSNVPVQTMDVTATILEIVGSSPREDYPLDGTSLAAWILQGGEEPQRDLLWRTRQQGALRRGDFKILIDRKAKPLWFTWFGKEGERVRLIHVAEDGRERKDVSTLYPDLTASMLEAWKEFDESLLPYERTEQPVAGNVSGAKDD
jgi:arylsulfatase A-like enzyme